MKFLDSFDYSLEKWKYESVIGIRKIAWFYSMILLLALIPAYALGTLLAGIWKPKTPTSQLFSIVTSAPNFKTEPTNALSYANNKRGFYGRISANRNDSEKKDIGYYPWVYRYAIKDINGKVLIEGGNTSYLLPNSDAYVIGPITTEPGIQFEITTDTQKSVPIKFSLANSKLVEVPIVTASNYSFVPNSNPNLIDIKFTLNNTSTYNIKTVDTTFALRNKDNQIIGIGKYVVQNLAKQEVRHVSLTYPSPILGTNTTLEVIPQINYLNEENLQLNVR